MFLPRAVKRKHDQASSGHEPSQKLRNASKTEISKVSRPESSTNELQSNFVTYETKTPTETAIDAARDADVEEEVIKLFSSEQRLIVPGQDEPECVICGKYGEYINDDTDNDVCSMECKRIDTDMYGNHVKTTTHPPPEAKIVHCYVANNVHAKLTNYQEAPDVADMTQQQKKAMMAAFNIKVKGTQIPNPITSFEQSRETLGPQLTQNIDQHGWFMATAVQRLAVPCMLAGRDVYAIAPVGSGKTGAFAIPILAHCQSLSAKHRHKRRSGPYALILSPTRDLCVQIESTIKDLARGLRNTRTALLVGNQPIADQIYRLRKGVQIVIGTPGRILDIATYHPHMLRLWRMHLVVLDEASVLLGAGLNKQVHQILGKLSTKIVRQTCLFTTATSQETEKLSRKLIQPIEINVDQLDLEKEEKAVKKLQKHTNIKQTVLWVENASKNKKLLMILDDPKYFVAPVVVFVQSRLAAEFLTRSLKKRRLSGHWRVVAMHADKTLEERSEIIEGMNAQEPAWDVVISTDVLASGINLSRVRLVINYDMASSLDSYARRIACAATSESTSKPGRRGHAITFVNNEDKHLLEKLAKLLANKPPTDVTPLPPELRRLL